MSKEKQVHAKLSVGVNECVSPKEGWGKTCQPTPKNIAKKIHGESLSYGERWQYNHRIVNEGEMLK